MCLPVRPALRTLSEPARRLDPGAPQVGVHAAGRQEHGPAGQQHLVPQQQRRHDAQVAGMVGGLPAAAASIVMGPREGA